MLYPLLQTYNGCGTQTYSLELDVLTNLIVLSGKRQELYYGRCDCCDNLIRYSIIESMNIVIIQNINMIMNLDDNSDTYS